MPKSPERCRLSIAIVTCGSDRYQLEVTLRSLAVAVARARAAGLVDEASLTLVDQSPDPAYRHALASVLERSDVERAVPVRRVDLTENLGFGAAHNLAMDACLGDWHLVLNPDVDLAPESIECALRALRDHPEVVALSPHVLGGDGQREYLCKRHPAVITLLLRGFAPRWLRRCFRTRLYHYEMRDVCNRDQAAVVDLISGCFMLLRASALREVGGFDPRFFMYFEDFDLSLRLRALGTLRFDPSVRIAHRGGYTARKGWRHIRWFVTSAWRFFDRHGWRWS